MVKDSFSRRFRNSGRDTGSYMYTEDKVAIDVNGNVGGLLSLSRGVKQGCILSPLLFNIFISDLGEELDQTSRIKLGTTKISGKKLIDLNMG